MSTWYRIVMNEDDDYENLIFTGYFKVINEIIVEFYEQINGEMDFSNNILGPSLFPPPADGWIADNFFNDGRFSHDIGTNISSLSLQSIYNTPNPYFNIYGSMDGSMYVNFLYDVYTDDNITKNITITEVSNPISNICFPKNTKITCDQGDISIDQIDNNIHTINNKFIIGITKTISKDEYLVCLEKDALEFNVPSQKTIISKTHKILHNGKMLMAEQLLNLNEKIYKIDYDGEVLYNVLMENRDKLLVNNLICETLHPKNNISKLFKLCQGLNIHEQFDLIEKYNKEYERKNSLINFEKFIENV